MRSKSMIKIVAGVLLLCLFVSSVSACPTPTVTSITPNNGIYGTTVSYNISGSNFVTAMGTSVTVKLTQTGSSDITATVSTRTSTKLTGTIPLGTAPKTGVWSVKVTNNDGTGSQPSALNVKFTVNKATPTITWPNPADIPYGTALGANQMNAVATGVGGVSLGGTFTYAPPS